MARIFRLFPRAGDLTDPLWRRRQKRFERVAAVAALGLWFVVFTVAISPRATAPLPEVAPGDTWSGRVMVAPVAISVKDEAKIAAGRRRVEETHAKYFVADEQIHEDSLGRLGRMFAALRDNAATSMEAAALRERILDQTGMGLEEPTVAALRENRGNKRVEEDLRSILSHLFVTRGVTDDRATLAMAGRDGRLVIVSKADPQTSVTVNTAEVLGHPAEAMDYLMSRHVPSFRQTPELAAAYVDAIGQLLKPNIHFDAEQTQRRKMAALRQVSGTVVFEPGEVILRPGDSVNALQARAMDELRDHLKGRHWLRVAGNALLVAIVMFFGGVYCRRYQGSLALTARDVTLVSVPLLLAVLTGRGVLALAPSRDIALFAFPSAMIAMVFVMVFNARLATAATILGTVLFGGVTGMSYEFLLPALTGGLATVAAIFKFRERHQVLAASGWVVLANIVAVVCVDLGEGNMPGRADLAAAFGNGIGCYMLGLSTLPLLERLFRVTTNWRLMELTSGGHPLMRQLEERAPGTYQHVLNVTKLAESAAEAVDANYLLVRAGAYFHDIGKMLKPKYFTENQVTAEERKVHSRLSPYMSALIVKNHVKEGVELARRHNLPERVVDFIPQHHGTSLIQYFYNQAVMKSEVNEVVTEGEFRYPGPKPQSIEAAIVMIADSVEATTTAKLTSRVIREEDVRRVIRDTIHGRFDDGQFDECRMTLRDLHEINEALVRAVLARYHQRIDYPALPRQEVRDITKVPVTQPGVEQSVGGMAPR